jgi:N-acetylglucosaminyldiphosphoundecaprenol N-acetyl-beta-D-mannosaminyltransferase
MSARAGTFAPEILAPETNALLGHGKVLLERHEATDEVRQPAAALSAPACELSREVYCLQGIPVDAVDMPEVVRRIETAAATRSPFLISTPNVNFLIGSRHDETFRESLLCSDLCPADGMPLVWIAKLTGVPIKKRVAGSDIFEVLKTAHDPAHRLKLYLFGGGEGAATDAAQALNARLCGWSCVGRMNPGFGPVESMSSKEIIDEINASDADFLAVALGATKGQTWLLKNHHRLQVPIRAHLGATVNFLSGRVRRAPRWMRVAGLEWLWRIKEEPHLWKRYGKDGLGLLGLMVSQVLPLAVLTQWEWLCWSGERQALATEVLWRGRDVTLRLSGAATEKHVKQAISSFVRVVSLNPSAVTIDVSKVTTIDARFLGLLLVLWKLLRVQNIPLTMHGATRRLRTLFRLQGVGYLLSSQNV